MPVTPFFSAPSATRADESNSKLPRFRRACEIGSFLSLPNWSLVGGCSPLEPDGAWASKKNLKVKWGCYPSYGWNTSHIVMFETSNSALAILKMSLAACIMDKSMICSTEFHQPHVRDQCGTSWDISKFLSLATSWCIFTKHFETFCVFQYRRSSKALGGPKMMGRSMTKPKTQG